MPLEDVAPRCPQRAHTKLFFIAYCVSEKEAHGSLGSACKQMKVFLIDILSINFHRKNWPGIQERMIDLDGISEFNNIQRLRCRKGCRVEIFY